MPEGNKRLRILAGPNGSGKSTIIKKLRSRYYCGYFVNADEIHQIIDTKRVLNLDAEYGLLSLIIFIRQKLFGKRGS
jgi:predicted ABC-type ATPase